MVRMHLGSVLASKNMSQRELGRRSKVALHTITKLVNGKASLISFETLERICKTLDIGPGELMTVEVGKAEPAK